jgi:glycerol-3-phosphate acyltransferase PlsY
MAVWENILIALGSWFFGYMLGSVPTGVIIGRVFFQKDPRDFGSHNSGGTNSGRVFGRKIGILVIALDVLKTLVAFWGVWAILSFSGIKDSVALWDGGNLYYWLAALGAAMGHCWSPWLKFKGGKAVACFMAIIGGTSWLGAIVCLSVFLPIFFSKRIMSRSSLLSGAILVVFEWAMALLTGLSGWNGAILMWTFGFAPTPLFGWEAAAVATLVYGILVYRHRQNIVRLRQGLEEPLNW